MKIKIPFKKSKHFNVGVLRRENIRGLRYKQKSSGMLSHFTYTSQGCSKCCCERKTNRKGKLFKCVSCSFECNSDVNASLNISFDLPFIGKVERLTRKNLKVFYLYEKGKEPIVYSTERV